LSGPVFNRDEPAFVPDHEPKSGGGKVEKFDLTRLSGADGRDAIGAGSARSGLVVVPALQAPARSDVMTAAALTAD
jgi:hypothetical protein